MLRVANFVQTRKLQLHACKYLYICPRSIDVGSPEGGHILSRNSRDFISVVLTPSATRSAKGE